MKNDGKSSAVFEDIDAAFLHINAAFGNIDAAFLQISAAFEDIDAAFLHISVAFADIDAAFPVVLPWSDVEGALYHSIPFPQGWSVSPPAFNVDQDPRTLAFEMVTVGNLGGIEG